MSLPLIPTCTEKKKKLFSELWQHKIFHLHGLVIVGMTLISKEQKTRFLQTGLQNSNRLNSAFYKDLLSLSIKVEHIMEMQTNKQVQLQIVQMSCKTTVLKCPALKRKVFTRKTTSGLKFERRYFYGFDARQTDSLLSGQEHYIRVYST